ncbi:MAG: M48 family metalloprotease [Polyangiales bacterium]
MLTPLPYHDAIRGHLKEHVAAAWSHFRSDEWREEHAREADLELAKSTVLLDEETHARVYELARDAAQKVGVKVDVELFQGDAQGGLNAALYFAPDRARIVLYGPLQERLQEDELLALLGHELAHHVLWTTDEGEFFTTMRTLNGLSWAGASESIAATERMYRLTTETFADRGGYLASGSTDALIRCLIKTRTQLSEVDAQAFLRQAEKVIAQTKGSEAFEHPETYLRAKAITLFADRAEGSEEEVQELLTGALELHDLDLVGRVELSALSRSFVDHLLAPDWFRTTAVLAHAGLLFEDYSHRAPQHDVATLETELRRYGPTSLDYLAFLLLDFIVVDTDLADLPLAQAQTLAESVGLLDRLEKHVNRELKMTKKAIASVRAQRETLLTAALTNESAP